MTNNELSGYWNADRKVGIRKHVALVGLSPFSTRTTYLISETVQGTVPLAQPHGRNEMGQNAEMFMSSMTKIGTNPNVNSVLVVGYEPKGTDNFVRLFKSISNKRIESINILEIGTFEAVKKGSEIAQDLVIEASEVHREPMNLEDLTIGVKCGGSDTTSGIASNPAVGNAVDRFIDSGATAIFSETTEIIGAEHILARRAVSEEVADKILMAAKKNEEAAMALGIDLVGINPVPDNIKGGLSTIEEKSIGAIMKSGTRPIVDVLNYEQIPNKKGLHFMDSPSAAQEVLTALTCAGAQLLLFSTGNGNITGGPGITPVIKVCGNPRSVKRVSNHIDIDVSDIIEASTTHEQAGKRIFDFACKVIGGRMTKAEAIKEYVFGPLPTGL